MLTRFIKIQLTIFASVSLIGVVVMVTTYLQVPTLLGIGRMSVAVELPYTGGLYRFANVTYRGVQVGRVTEVALISGPPIHTKAVLSLDSSAKIPADLTAEVHSISAIGEQFVDLVPHTASGPYLRDGSTISMRNTIVPQQVGPVLDQVSALLGSIPKDKLNALVDESFAGLHGADFDLGSLADSSSTLSHDLNAISGRAKSLIDDSAPLLDAQAATTDSIRTWAHSLAGVSSQLVANDSQIRTLLRNGPGAADEVSQLLSQLKPTLPVLLANLTTIGEIAVTYNASLQQVLLLLPPFVSTIQAAMPRNNATGVPTGGEFALTAGDPNPCTAGFLPPSAWRSPADTTDIDTPEGLYCKLPQDSPSTVRGARNYPCIRHPGRRAATVQECDGPQGFQPLVERQHIVGPAPIDPNLIAQGIPPDRRVTFGDNIFAPITGTPAPSMTTPTGGAQPEAGPAPGPVQLPPTPGPVQLPSTPGPESELPPGPVPSDQPDIGGSSGPAAAPSGFTSGGSQATPGGGQPSFAVAQYNPRTGNYVGADGRVYTQSNLTGGSPARTWTDLFPH